MKDGLKLLFILLCCWGNQAKADSESLWYVVNNLCVAKYELLKTAFPCDSVDISQGKDKGYAIVPNLKQKYHYLLVPTRKISGIESALLLKSSTPNYFELAWRARNKKNRVDGKIIPRNAFILGINSPNGRSQEQMHIHLSCIKPEVKKQLMKELPHIRKRFSSLKIRILGYSYSTKFIEQSGLNGIRPFEILFKEMKLKPEEMREYGLAIVPVENRKGKPGFILLATKSGSSPKNRGSIEHLMDFNCSQV